jgi:hypothetical protein
MPAYEAANVLTDFPPEAADVLLAMTGPGSASPQLLVEIRKRAARPPAPGTHDSAFCARNAAYALLTVGIPGVPGVEDHAAAVQRALRPGSAVTVCPTSPSTPTSSSTLRRVDPRPAARRDPHVRPEGVIAMDALSA